MLQVGFILNKSKRKYDLPLCTVFIFISYKKKNAHFQGSNVVFIEMVLIVLQFQKEKSLGQRSTNTSGQPHRCGEGGYTSAVSAARRSPGLSASCLLALLQLLWVTL